MYGQVIYKFSFSRFKVAKEIQFFTDRKIINATVKTIDSYGNIILNELKNIKIDEKNTTLSFDYFYGKDYEVTLFGDDISYDNISDIEVLELDQLQFKVGDDAPHKEMLNKLMDKSKMNAISNSGFSGNNSPEKAIDSNVNTYFLSESYESLGFGEFLIDLGDVALIDNIEFLTNSNEDGKIKSYKFMYRTSSSDTWKEIFSELDNNSTKKNKTFETVLAKELCIKVLDSGYKKVYIAEVNVFKYCSLENEVYDLFLVDNKSQLREDVTQDMIVDLQERATYTESYMRLLEVASDLYIERENLIPKALKISLNGESVINRIAFKADRNMIKSEIRYKDCFGILRVKRLYWYVENKVDGIITIGVEEYAGRLRVHTDSAEILVYGTENAEFVSVETLPLDNFSLREEKDNRIDLKASYSSENKTEENLLIKKEYLLSEIRTSKTGDAKIFVKDTGRSSRLSWDDLPEKKEYVEIGTLKNNVLKLEKAYFTDEIKIESSSGERYLENIELYQYNSIGDEVENLYLNDNYLELKENIDFETILDVESRVKNDGIYIEKVKKAKALFIENSLTEEIELQFEDGKILSEIKVRTLEKAYRVELAYENRAGDILRKDCNFKIDEENEELTINFEKIYAVKIKLKIHGIDRAYKPKTDALSIESYLVSVDTDEEFSFNNQNSTVRVSQKGSYTDYFIALNKEEVFYKFKISSKSNIFIKDMFTGNYIEFKENVGFLENDKGYLVKEFIFRVYNNLSEESSLENLKAFKISKLKLAIDSLFIGEELAKFVTFDYITELEKAVVQSQEYLAKLKIAKDIIKSEIEDTKYKLLTNKNLPIKSLVLSFNDEIENIFEYKLYSKDLLENIIEIEDFSIDVLENRKEIRLSFNEIYSTQLEIVLKIAEVEASKFAVAYEEYSIKI
ncbi:MAG: discoidin domain-containing protein [Cetobacterium sp.]